MIRCGIIGFGKIGQIRAREIKANPDTDLCAIFEVGETVNIDSHIAVCSSAEELINMDLDAIFVCAYNNVAAEYTIKSLEAGKHVFCEKPPARSTQEMIEVRKKEKESGKILKYGFNHRYHHSVIEAGKLAQKKVFGELLWLRGIYGKAGGNQFASNWRNNKGVSGGGILIDQGIHMLDLMCFFAGDFTHVQSMVQTRYWDIEVEDNVFAIMKTESGVSAMIHSSATQWRHRFSLDMCFENGYINLDGILSSTRSYGDETLIIARRQFEDSTFAFGKPREERIYFDTDESWKLELDEFVNAISNGGTIKEGNSEDALKVMELVEEIYRQSK